ncbi:DUF1772 domain-containing protein [Lipingzhangella sp. LS1_29]|uniref:DUF1772 domain-containing protein n=1 Tax=Lipingzhangella rawalii TaxID=2055835 RepID=A0ABU2HAY4_9ACTN|nr:DUF1772 domain-containing protein [Lipingzhangella rawalii]MDS1272472.1 DUF1772 domain-containing protein [Lipingzhangella rawalii]
MAGLYFAFDVGVMPGLEGSDDRTFVTVMQDVNRAIENGLFGLVFVGAFLATGVAATLHHRIGHHRIARLVWAALGCYSGMLLVTTRVNIPLNTRLARAGPASTTARPEDLRDLRERFERPWRNANTARTVLCSIAFGLLCRALVLHGRAR